MTRTCAACYHWHPRDTLGNGSCKRRAPHLPNEGEPGDKARWPITNEADACGEHCTDEEQLIAESSRLIRSRDRLREEIARLRKERCDIDLRLLAAMADGDDD